jgi:hypothetical protein
MFRAFEYDRQTMQATGRIEFYHASDIATAVANLLYSKRLSNGAAKIGPTGRAVYSGNFCYSVTR